MRIFAIIALALLTSCTTVPVGSVALCIGVCRFTIKPTPPQSLAQQAGGLLGGVVADYLSKGRK